MPQACERALWLVLILTLFSAILVIGYQAACTPTYTIDSYFYLSKASQVARGEGLSTTWNDGTDAKYFPGYSIFLAIPFLLGASYVSLQLISYCLCVLFLFRIARGLGFDPGVQLLAATACAANPIVIKWVCLPMAEGVALMLSLLSITLLLGFLEKNRWPLLAAACMVGGVATITRVESLFLLAVFGTILFPKRRALFRPSILAGAALFLLPLAVYWIRLKYGTGQSPAYLGELRHPLPKFGLLKNFIYNLWVPFGFMHRPTSSFLASGLVSVSAVVGAVWFVLGQVIFIIGLILSFSGKLGAKARAVAFLFAVYALAHALWYYRYERFMFMAVPLAAIGWAIAVRTIFKFVKGEQGGRWWVLVLAQLLIAATGTYFGNHYSSRHAEALQQDTSRLGFQDIAEAVNGLNRETRSAVLTDLGPHLAYYVDAHTYLDTDHGNYWQRAFPPDRTLQEMDRLGIGFVVTRENLAEWLEAHQIPLSSRERFKPVERPALGALIIEYLP
jgi:hypothetical protein